MFFLLFLYEVLCESLVYKLLIEVLVIIEFKKQMTVTISKKPGGDTTKILM